MQVLSGRGKGHREPDVEQRVRTPRSSTISASAERAHHRPDRPAAEHVDFEVDAAAAAPACVSTSMNASRAASTASAQRGSSSKCQATIAPREHQQAVGERVEQRAEPAVLAR